MLLRDDGDAVVCIGQASHAWISGQLARAWREPQPEAVCLAAEQHDVGWAQRDLAPPLDPETGRPHDFMSLPFEQRIPLWREAPLGLLSQSVHAALLVSMHGTRLLGDDERAAAFVAEAASQQQAWMAIAGVREADALAQRDLLAEWDRISLALCLRWDLELDPWPLAVDELVVECEGRRLAGRFASEPELHRALAAAPLVSLRFVLGRGRVPQDA